MKENNIYNTPVEIALRLLMIIVKNKKEIDIDKLIIVDYLSLHGSLVNDELISIHPDNPFHGLEVYSKINVVKQGIELLISKGLIDVRFNCTGIEYTSNAISEYFLSYIDSEYYLELEKNIEVVTKIFKNYSSDDIRRYLYDNIELWNSSSVSDYLDREK